MDDIVPRTRYRALHGSHLNCVCGRDNSRFSAEPPQAPPIHVSTHLVQIGVIVRDHNGAVEDLTKEDFAVFDRGKPQSISVFTEESAASTPLHYLYLCLPTPSLTSPRSTLPLS